MNERRYVIDVVEHYHSMAPINIVAESDLKCRIEWIIQWLNADAYFSFTENAWQKVLSVIVKGLHGERGKEKYYIGDNVIDEDGNKGIVVIRWNDGDICEHENDAAHPNPRIRE